MKKLFAAALTLTAGLALGCSDDASGDMLGGGAPAGGFAGGGAGSGGIATAAGATTGGATSGGNTGGGLGGASGGVTSAGAAGSSTGGVGGSATLDGPGLYGLHCAMCHEEQGAGGLKGPEIQHPVREYSAWVVRNGRPLDPKWAMPMLAFDTTKLSDAQLTLIFDYLDKPAQPTTGPLLYGDYCQNCHGADGKSKPANHDITKEVDELAKMVRDGAHAGEYAKRDGFMPKFATTRLTDAEVELIRVYVDSL